MTRRSLILLCVAGGMALVALEVRFLHRGILTEYPQAWIPIVFGVLSAVAALLGIANLRPLQIVSAIVLACGVPVGLIGVQIHTEGSIGPIMQMIGAGSTRTQSGQEEEGEENEHGGESQGGDEEEEAPALAPLGLAGLGLIGALAAWPEKKKSDDSA